MRNKHILSTWFDLLGSTFLLLLLLVCLRLFVDRSCVCSGNTRNKMCRFTCLLLFALILNMRTVWAERVSCVGSVWSYNKLFNRFADFCIIPLIMVVKASVIRSIGCCCSSGKLKFPPTRWRQQRGERCSSEDLCRSESSWRTGSHLRDPVGQIVSFSQTWTSVFLLSVSQLHVVCFCDGADFQIKLQRRCLATASTSWK